MELLKGCIYNIQKFSLHDGPGIRTTVFFKGCPLCCTWCSNPESQKIKPELIWDNVTNGKVLTGSYYSVDEVMDILKSDRNYYTESGGGITVSGGEILSQSQFVIQLLEKCRLEEFHTACETSAYGSSQDFSSLLESVDLLIIDIKHHDEDKHQQKTGVSLMPILNNLDIAISKKHSMIVRIPIIPGYNHSIEDAKKFGELLNFHHVKEIELLPFHQFGKSKYRFLDRPYEFMDVPQLTSKDLTIYAEEIEAFGIQCKIG